MQTADRTVSGALSPVDDHTYNLLQSLTSKLEAIETFQKYAADGGETSLLFDRLAQEDARHARELLDALQEQLAHHADGGAS